MLQTDVFNVIKEIRHSKKKKPNKQAVCNFMQHNDNNIEAGEICSLIDNLVDAGTLFVKGNGALCVSEAHNDAEFSSDSHSEDQSSEPS